MKRHGGPRSYVHPDYHAELRHAPGFRDLEHQTECVTLRFSDEGFAALALSSSHARAAIDALGERQASDTLLRMVEPLLSRHGHVPFGYMFHLYTVRRD